MPTIRTLLDFMVEQGLIGRGDAERVQREDREHGGGAIFNLLKLKLATAPKLFAFVEENMGLLYSLPEDSPPDPTLLDLIPPNIAHFYKIVPLSLEGNTLTLAASAVSSSQLLPAIEEITGYKVKVMITHPAALNRALDSYYGARLEAGVVDATSGERIFVLKDEDKQVRPVTLHMLNESSAPADWLRTILAEAVMKRSRHIHFRQHGDDVHVSFVKEGEAYVEFKLVPALFQSIATFIDYLTGLGGAELQSPQEKRVKIKINERMINLQISSVPLESGRSLTFELYDDKSFEGFFQNLFDARHGEEEFVRNLMRERKGMVLISASPTAQKKLVLYSLLRETLRTTQSVFTLEESVFYTMPGVQQVSTGIAGTKAFSRMLEAALRQRPEVLAIETVREAAAMEMVLLSCSRCLVVSVYTSPDLFATLRWLADNGFRSALRARIIPAIIQATTVDRLCKYCRKECRLDENELSRYGMEEHRETIFYSNSGCPFCKGAGILHEEPLCAVTPIDDELVALLDQPAPRQAILTRRRLSARAGAQSAQSAPSFPTLLQKGLALAAAGKADVLDVLRKCAFLA
ncbi:MAG: Flp pilus assembly complex ATPase component TadA [Acidobacteria bacterium]|nr:Flp pilus assembly complex ATPase component TadA [Acidobacteriota bacterium]